MAIELSVERFKRLPRRSDDEWQGGLVRMPAWIERGPDGRPYRPWAGFWVSGRTGFVHFKAEPEMGVHDWRLALDALVEFAMKPGLAGYRPARLRVADEELGRRLLDALGDSELALAVVPELAEVRRILADLSEHMSGRPPIPGALEADGVTVDRMRAFADAAARFYEAAPWRHLSGDDLLQVEAPVSGPGLGFVTVLGSSGQTFGLGFFESAADYDEVETAPAPDAFAARPRWSLFYERLSKMPFGDADIWEQHNLPVAGDNAYPVVVQFKLDRTTRRPDARVLSYLEGLLRAIADTSEGEMDQGRWTRSTRAYDGPVEYRLCIPELLQPLDVPPRRLSPERFDRRAMERVMSEVERFMTASRSTTSTRPTRHFGDALAGSWTRSRPPRPRLLNARRR
jgi:hypothetical protein